MINQNDRDKPKKYILQALEELNKINGQVIVEIGSMRQICLHDLNVDLECCNDGHSSLLFAKSGYDFTTVDIDPKHFEITKFSLDKFHNAKCVCDDALLFLEHYNGKKIDLLFLDAWDVDNPNSAELHLKAYLLSKPHLNTSHLILIDDTDVDYQNDDFVYNKEGIGGKGKLLIQYLIDNGYKILLKGRQTLLWK
jgi:hypothetical protein